MKKTLAVILAVCMTLALFAGCSAKTEAPATTTTAAATTPAADPNIDANGFYIKPLFELSYADQNPENALVSAYPLAAAEEIYQNTKGAVKLNMYFSESLVKYSEMLSGVCQGMSDITYLLSSQAETTQVWPQLWDRLYPTGAPKVDKMTKIYQQLLTDVPEIQAEMEKAGAKWLSISATPGRHLHGMKDFYKTPADLKGKNIGATGADAKFYNAMGGSAVKLSTSERYTSLQSAD